MIEGLATIVLAVIGVFVLPDFPHSSKFLNPEERALAQLRLVTAESNSNIKPLSHKEAFMAAVKDKKVSRYIHRDAFRPPREADPPLVSSRPGS